MDSWPADLRAATDALISALASSCPHSAGLPHTPSLTVAIAELVRVQELVNRSLFRALRKEVSKRLSLHHRLTILEQQQQQQQSSPPIPFPKSSHPSSPPRQHTTHTSAPSPTPHLPADPPCNTRPSPQHSPAAPLYVRPCIPAPPSPPCSPSPAARPLIADHSRTPRESLSPVGAPRARASVFVFKRSSASSPPSPLSPPHPLRAKRSSPDVSPARKQATCASPPAKRARHAVGATSSPRALPGAAARATVHEAARSRSSGSSSCAKQANAGKMSRGATGAPTTTVMTSGLEGSGMATVQPPALPTFEDVQRDLRERRVERAVRARELPLPCDRCRVRKRADLLRERGFVDEMLFERWAARPGGCLGHMHMHEAAVQSPFSFDETATESPNE